MWFKRADARHRPVAATGLSALLLLALATALPPSAAADGPHAVAPPGVGLSLPGRPVADGQLERIRARNVDAGAPAPSAQHTGVVLWDERGPRTRSQQRSSATGSGNTQSHRLDLRH